MDGLSGGSFGGIFCGHSCPLKLRNECAVGNAAVEAPFEVGLSVRRDVLNFTEVCRLSSRYREDRPSFITSMHLIGCYTVLAKGGRSLQVG